MSSRTDKFRRTLQDKRIEESILYIYHKEMEKGVREDQQKFSRKGNGEFMTLWNRKTGYRYRRIRH